MTLPVLSHADRPRETWRPGVETRMLVSAQTGASALCIFEQWVAPGAGAPTHSHPVEEVLTVLAGRAEVWLGDERAVLTRGRSVVVAAGEPHGFRNVGRGTLHVQAVLAAPAFEASFDGCARPVRRWLPRSDLPGR
jgi:quercetin dioxygenase-like cupin family protein